MGHTAHSTHPIAPSLGSTPFGIVAQFARATPNKAGDAGPIPAYAIHFLMFKITKAQLQ